MCGEGRTAERSGRPSLRDAAGSVRIGETVAGPLRLPLDGARVDQCGLDRALTLTLEKSSRHWTLRLEGGFRLVVGEDSPEQFGSDDDPPSAYGPAVDQLDQATIAEASVMADGTLKMSFEDGLALEIAPHFQWEAWTLNGPAGELIVCGPGGQLSRWSGE